jgi:hypothetical protein
VLRQLGDEERMPRGLARERLGQRGPRQAGLAEVTQRQLSCVSGREGLDVEPAQLDVAERHRAVGGSALRRDQQESRPGRP